VVQVTLAEDVPISEIAIPAVIQANRAGEFYRRWLLETARAERIHQEALR